MTFLEKLNEAETLSKIKYEKNRCTHMYSIYGAQELLNVLLRHSVKKRE